MYSSTTLRSQLALASAPSREEDRPSGRSSFLRCASRRPFLCGQLNATGLSLAVIAVQFAVSKVTVHSVVALAGTAAQAPAPTKPAKPNKVARTAAARAGADHASEGLQGRQDGGAGTGIDNASDACQGHQEGRCGPRR
jgi:hypothetical protein